MKQLFKLSTLLAWGCWLLFSSNSKAQDNLALAFDGNGDYISLNPLPAVFSNNPAFTVEAWFYANNPGTGCLGDFRPLVSLFDLATSHVFEVAICDGGKLHYYFNNGTSLLPPFPLSNTDYSGACHHLAVTRNGSQFEAFVDGVSIYVGSLGSNLFNFNTFHVGGGTSFVAGPDWEGQVDEIRLWNTVRSAQQIKDFKDCSLSGTSSGLVVNWTLDNDGAIPEGDNSPSGQNITQVLDAAGPADNGNLNGFNLTLNNNTSNYVGNSCPPRYVLYISDQISFFPVLLTSICEGDYVHFCVSDNFTGPVIVPSGTMVEWQSSDANGPWGH